MTKESKHLFGMGCDQNIGGYSTCSLDSTENGTLKFSGNISLALAPGSSAMYSGYAAFRSLKRPREHIFDDTCINIGSWKYLVLRVKGDHRSYSFNLKLPNTLVGDLFVCKFQFLRPYEWEHVILPISYFKRSNCGVEYKVQYSPNLFKVSSLGFLLADNLPGPFSLEIDYIMATNDPSKYLDSKEKNDVSQNMIDPTSERVTEDVLFAAD